MLESMGYQTKVSNNYHAVIIAYFMNMLLPRAGEVSRAGVMMRYEGIPFEKGFGSILAERVIDVIMLVIVASATLWMQGEKYPEMITKYEELKAQYTGSTGSWGMYFWIIVSVIAVTVLILYIKHPGFRSRIKGIFKGMADGLLSIVRLKKRWQFLAHTVFIWVMYVGLYWVIFFSIPETSHIDPRGMMLGFLAGGISIIIVQGGIGVYPVFVATALSFYFSDYPLLYALGWLAWLAQTALIVVAGMISLYLLPRVNPKST